MLFAWIAAQFNFYLAFSRVCSKHLSNWFTTNTYERVAVRSISIPQIPHKFDGFSVALSSFPSIFIATLLSFKGGDDPPARLVGQFAGILHQRHLCQKKSLLMRTRIRRESR